MRYACDPCCVVEAAGPSDEKHLTVLSSFFSQVFLDRKLNLYAFISPTGE